MRIINVTPDMTVLPLGRLGENERTQFVFDVNEWLAEYPDANIGLMVRLPHAEDSYPVILSDEGDGKYAWTVTSADMSVEGTGKCQLKAIKNQVIVKSKRYNTRIDDALDGQGDAPAEWESWLDAIQRAAGLAIIKDGKLRFAINDAGHLIMSYTDDVPIDGEGDSSTTEDDVTWIHKDLGPVEAYAQAVAGGYTGTKAEWIAEIANASTNAQSALTYKEAAELAKDAAQEAAETASAAYNVNLLAPNYDDYFVYKKGDFVIYNGGFYRAKQDFTTSEAWTAAHWEQVTFDSVVKVLQEKADNLRDEIGDDVIDFIDNGQIGTSTTDVGDTLSLSPHTGGNYRYYSYAIRDVAEGDIITIEHIYTNSVASYFFIDSDNVVLEKGTDGEKTDLELTAPENAAKIVINTRRRDRGLCYIGKLIRDRKADKVENATAGNFAALDSNGNLTDSGKKASDFDVSGKADKVNGSDLNNYLASLKSDGNLKSSGKKVNDILLKPITAGTQGQVLTSNGNGGHSWEDPTGADPTLITVDYSELTFPVAEGKLCYHSGLLYKANQEIATSEAWTAAHWTQTTIEAEQSTLKNQIMQTGAYYIDRNLFKNPTSVNSNASNVINASIIEAQTKGLQYCVIPEGEYWITQTIYLKSDVILCGCGIDATTLKIADGCDIDAIRVAEPVNNSGLMDLAIDGNRIENYSVFVNGHHGNAINVWLHYGRIERVRTNWVFKHSLLLNYETGNSDDGLGFEPEHQNDMGNLNKVLWCDFRDSLLQGVMWGWRTMDSWMCYTNIGSHAANMYLEGGTSRFIGNHFDGDGDNGAGPEYNVYCGDGCRAMVFEGNIFENTQKENIFFRQPSYSNQTMTITIANNIIRTCSKSQNEQYANIKISGYSGSVPATEIVISGNQILNPDTNANHGYAGIHLLYCENSKIVGNTFFNVGDEEVLLDSTCENVLNDSEMSEELSSLKTEINSKYEKPNTGIPATDMAQAVQTSLEKADSAYQKPQTGIPASDLASGVIPAVPVQDVQINGTSILDAQGVANVPLADGTNPGAVIVGSGLSMDANGKLYANFANSTRVKAGTASNYMISPDKQHESVFYALAKLAGADMASSSNPVGQFTNDALVKIQKMLGVYQSPWELIREDTVTNASEADVEINVDGDGNAFELTDVYLQVWTPQQETAASIGDYGRVQSYYGSNNIIVSQMGTWTQSANASAKYGQVLLTNKNGAIRNEATQNATQYTLVNVTSRTNIISDDALLKIGTYSFEKITIKKVTGTMKYKLYGRRKWN